MTTPFSHFWITIFFRFFRFFFFSFFLFFFFSFCSSFSFCSFVDVFEFFQFFYIFLRFFFSFHFFFIFPFFSLDILLILLVFLTTFLFFFFFSFFPFFPLPCAFESQPRFCDSVLVGLSEGDGIASTVHGDIVGGRSAFVSRSFQQMCPTLSIIVYRCLIHGSVALRFLLSSTSHNSAVVSSAHVRMTVRYFFFADCSVAPSSSCFGSSWQLQRCPCSLTGPHAAVSNVVSEIRFREAAGSVCYCIVSGKDLLRTPGDLRDSSNSGRSR